MFRVIGHAPQFIGSWLICALGISTSTALAEYHLAPQQRMIYDVKITAELPDQKQTLSGHAFYTIKSVDSTGRQGTADFVANFRTSNVSTNSPMSFVASPTPFFGIAYSMPREIVIDQAGRVVRYPDDEPLPFLLGNAWDLAMVPIQGDKTQWDVQQTMELERRVGKMPIPWFLNSQEHRSAQESISYQVLPHASGDKTVQVKYQLTADETADGQPIFRDTGTGEIVFDKQSGWVKSQDMTFRIVTHQDRVTTEIPVELHIKLLDPVEAQRAWQERQDDFARAQREFAVRNTPRLLDNDAIDSALMQLKSTDAFKVRDACEQLQHAIVVKARQTEVGSALEPLLKHSEEMVRLESAKALAVWADHKNIPSLKDAINSGDILLRQGAIDALGHIHDQRAAEIVAGQLLHFEVRYQAEQALIKMGPVAEPSVLPMLKNPDWATRLSACKILAAIGTRHSLPDLQTISNQDENKLVTMSADQAVAAIRSRMK